jgi:hypothetical protein
MYMRMYKINNVQIYFAAAPFSARSESAFAVAIGGKADMTFCGAYLLVTHSGHQLSWL